MRAGEGFVTADYGRPGPGKRPVCRSHWILRPARPADRGINRDRRQIATTLVREAPDLPAWGMALPHQPNF